MPTDTPRNAEEIAQRAIALHCIVAAAHGVPKDQLAEWLKEENLWIELTPRELLFMSPDEPVKREVAWMTWFAEAEFVLLWAIGKVERLPSPTSKCDTGFIFTAMPGLFEATLPFIESAALRTEKEIEEEEERMYDIHCTVRGALRAGMPVPGGHDKDVVFFRHYALSWITGYCGQSWDAVTPDT